MMMMVVVVVEAVVCRHYVWELFSLYEIQGSCDRNRAVG